MSGLGVAGSSSVPRYVDGEGADTLTAGSLAAQPLTPAVNTAAVSATNRRRPRAGRYDTRQAPFTLWYSRGLIVRTAGLHPTSSRTTASASSRPRRVSTARPASTRLSLTIRRSTALGELNDSLADDFHRWHSGFTHVPDRQVLAA